MIHYLYAGEYNLELELSDLARTLGDLFANKALKRERSGGGQYEYRFRADLLRLWVRQAHEETKDSEFA